MGISITQKDKRGRTKIVGGSFYKPPLTKKVKKKTEEKQTGGKVMAGMQTKYRAKGKVIGKKAGKMIGMKSKYMSKGGVIKKKTGGRVK